MADKRGQSRILLLGAGGQLGGAFQRALGPRVTALDHSQLDLGDAPGLAATLARLRPSLIINGAAFNYVDRAERDRRAALEGNALGPARLARWAHHHGARLLHFSSDYVFGADRLARPRTESDPPAPMNFYGYTKLLGEEAVLRLSPRALVVRVAHLFGASAASPWRQNLVQRFIAQARAGQPLWVARGQWLNPTSVTDLVPACLTLLERGETGLFHLTGAACPAATFAREVLRQAGLDAELQLLDRDDRPAPRARHSALENRRWSALGLPPLPDWPDALRRYLPTLHHA